MPKVQVQALEVGILPKKRRVRDLNIIKRLPIGVLTFLGLDHSSRFSYKYLISGIVTPCDRKLDMKAFMPKSFLIA